MTDYLSVTVAGRRLGISTLEVLERVGAKQLPAAKRDGRVVIPVSALEPADLR